MRARIRDRLIQPGNPRSLSARSRARRWNEFLTRFPDLDVSRVLDLGGTPRFWRIAPVRPMQVTIVNMNRMLSADEPWIELVISDACAAGRWAGYDLVVSNSLLEHVGGPDRRSILSEAIHHAANRYWVQTPNRYFPIEPHWLFPGFQFLPLSLRTLITRTWPFGHRYSRDPLRAAELAAEVELIGKGELKRLFPDAEIWVERLAGMPKSLVAIRS